MDEVKYFVAGKGNVTLGELIRGNYSKAELSSAESVRVKVTLTKLPQVTELKANEVKLLLDQAGIRNGLASAIPKIFPQVVEDPEQPDQLTTEGDSFRAPEYHIATKTVRTPDYVFSKLNAMISTSSSHNVEEIRELRRQITKVANEHYLGNGSVKGQLMRLVAQKQQADYAESNRSMVWPNDEKSLMMFAKGIRKYFNLQKSSRRIPTTAAELLDPPEGVLPLYINQTAEAGVPYPSKIKRRDVLGSDVKQFEQMLKAGDIPDWARFVRVKPKSEVYKASDINSKIRNICVSSSGMSLLALMFVQTASASFSKDQLSCLAGFSMQHGGATKLLRHMESQGKGIMVFSDNIFLFEDKEDHVRFRSMDGRKMEGTHVDPEALKTMMRITKMMTGDAIDSRSLKILLNTAPKMYINTMGIFDKYYLKVPGLATGSPITFLLNHFQMSIAARMMEGIDIGASDEDVNKRIAKTGIFLETTLTTVIHKGRLGLTEIDFLGYDLFRETWHGQEYDLLVLNRDRLLKAISFDKTKLRDHTDMSPIKRTLTTLINRITKHVVLYLIGGHVWSDLSRYLESLVEEDIIHLPKGQELTSVLDDALENFGDEIDESIKAAVVSIVNGEESLSKERAMSLATSQSSKRYHEVAAEGEKWAPKKVIRRV